MGLDQLGVVTVGMHIPKEGGHIMFLITLLANPPWSRKPLFLVCSPKVTTLGHIACIRWSTRQSLTLETTCMGLQGTTKAGARLQSKRMCRCFENRSRLR